LAPASDAAASPALTPHEAVVKAMATLQQADPTLTSVQAQERVAHADPTLWERQRQVHLYGRESAPPVQTAALTYEQIVHLAKACAALTQRTTEEELAALALDHPDEGAYWQAARRFHLGEGRQEQAAAGRVAKAPPGGTASVPDGTVPETAGQRAYARLLRRAQEKYPELSPQEWHRKILLTVEGQNAMSDHRREVLFGPTGQEGA